MPLGVPILKPQKFHLFTPGQWKSGLERWTGDRLVLGLNPAAATSLRNFGNSVYPALPVSFGGDNNAVSTRYFSEPGAIDRDQFAPSSRPVRAQLPVSTREQPEHSFRFLETTSRHETSGRDRLRSVAPSQLCRVDARPLEKI